MNDNKKEIEKVEETTEKEMNVVVVKKGFFTRVGECLDRNKAKVAVGAAAVAATIGMLVFVGSKHKSTDEDPSVYDEGFSISTIDVDPDSVTTVVNND